ncbi:MAG: glucokinase [Rhodanobacteraceae bacterium]|jgi:glucokinase|nr:glucokinase [Rhodanobacteraceae bacterium]
MSASAPVLVADVGGTHVRFALADPAAAQPLLADSIRRYRVSDFPTCTDAGLAYLGETGARATRGVFALAGPVEGDVVQITNHPWTIRRARLRAELALASVRFVNDFAAISLGIGLLGRDDVQAIGPAGLPRVGSAPTQAFAVLGPGTGLGAGAFVLRDGHALALESEGGHTAFAPRTDEEIAILRQLGARFGRVSNERLLSGGGLVNLHQALAAIHGRREEALRPEDITQAAADGEPACVRTLEVFCELLGAFAGDCVLAWGGWDGVFLAGGLMAPLLPWLQHGGFRRRFEDKGRMQARLAEVPSAAIRHPYAGLLGAAAFAVIDSGRSLIRAVDTPERS